MSKSIVLLTGMSGAGKTSAMNALEDMGYYCIDNFPKELLQELETLLKEKDKYKFVALSVSAIDYMYFVNFFDAISKKISIIYLDASDEELLLRYRFTRRQHPLIANGLAPTVEDAIEMERTYFDRVSEYQLSSLHIDTTKMSTGELYKRIQNRFQVNMESNFTITFQSFGFKHGLPMDADVVIDARFLPNPFYDPALRNKTGNDKDVYDYVMEAEETKQFIVKLKDYYDFVFKSYASQNKAHMIVAVGCTGGQHRSVSICNWMYDQYKTTYHCLKSHRDIGVSEQ